MELQSKKTRDDDRPDNPKIPEDYYLTVLDIHEERQDIIDYDRDGARGLVIKFRIDEEVELENDFNLEMTDGDVVVPFFAPAKLSVSEEGEDSRLSENLKKIDLHEGVLDILDQDVEIEDSEEEGEIIETTLKKAVLEHDHRLVASTEEQAKELKNALRAVLKGKQVRVDVENSLDDDESQVSKFSKVFDRESSSDESSQDEDSDSSDESGDDEEDVLFSEDDEGSDEN